MPLQRVFWTETELRQYFADRETFDHPIQWRPYTYELVDAKSMHVLALVISVTEPPGSMPFIYIAKE